MATDHLSFHDKCTLFHRQRGSVNFVASHGQVCRHVEGQRSNGVSFAHSHSSHFIQHPCDVSKMKLSDAGVFKIFRIRHFNRFFSLNSYPYV